MALYKYPSLRRRQERHRQRENDRRAEEGLTRHSDESHPFMAVLGHSPQHSATIESFELSDMGSPDLSHIAPKPSRQIPGPRRDGNTSAHDAITLPGSDTGLLKWVQGYEPNDTRY